MFLVIKFIPNFRRTSVKPNKAPKSRTCYTAFCIIIKNGKITRFDGVDIPLQYKKETLRIVKILPPVSTLNNLRQVEHKINVHTIHLALFMTCLKVTFIMKNPACIDDWNALILFLLQLYTAGHAVLALGKTAAASLKTCLCAAADRMTKAMQKLLMVAPQQERKPEPLLPVGEKPIPTWAHRGPYGGTPGLQPTRPPQSPQPRSHLAAAAPAGQWQLWQAAAGSGGRWSPCWSQRCWESDAPLRPLPESRRSPGRGGLTKSYRYTDYRGRQCGDGLWHSALRSFRRV